ERAATVISLEAIQPNRKDDHALGTAGCLIEPSGVRIEPCGIGLIHGTNADFIIAGGGTQGRIITDIAVRIVPTFQPGQNGLGIMPEVNAEMVDESELPGLIHLCEQCELREGGAAP